MPAVNALLLNNVASTLLASITNVATVLTVAVGEGARFPNPTGSEYFFATLSNVAGSVVEIIKVTVRATDVFTIVRGQDGTTGTAFSASDIIEMRPTAELFREKLAKDGDTVANLTITSLAADLAVVDGGTGAGTAAAARTNLGVGTADSPEFVAVNIGAATDTTITRTAAGRVAVEGVGVVRGPGSAIDNAIVRFNGTTGDLVQSSAPTITADGTIVAVAGNTTFPAVNIPTAVALQTTPSAGDIERDANAIYMTSDAGNRGVNLIEHFIRADVARTLTSTIVEQAIFNAPANGRLALETGTYFFECLLSLSAMSATSGNAAFDILGAGGATLGTVLYFASGGEMAVNTASSAINGNMSTAAQSTASLFVASVNTTMHAIIQGTFEVTAAGTIQPALTLVTAAAAVLAAGCYFRCRRVGSTTVVSVGQWD